MLKILSSVIVVGLVVVGGYFAFNLGGSETENKEINTAEDEAETSGKKMAFSEFVKQGGAYKCEVKQSMSDMQNDGTVYISGSNMRGEYNTIAEGREMQTSFILRDGYSYTWSSLMPNVGFKVKVNTDVSASGSGSASGTYSWNAEQIGDYNCEAWTADQTKFSIPTSITFQEIKSN
ncbi:MAG TPA: hypothetical protein VJC14_01090 [Candidatus Paceibacterota bacterium]